MCAIWSHLLPVGNATQVRHVQNKTTRPDAIVSVPPVALHTVSNVLSLFRPI